MGADMSVERGCCGGCLQKQGRTEISRIDTLPVVKVSENREKFCRSVAEEGKIETLKSLLLLKKTCTPFPPTALSPHPRSVLLPLIASLAAPDSSRMKTHILLVT